VQVPQAYPPRTREQKSGQHPTRVEPRKSDALRGDNYFARGQQYVRQRRCIDEREQNQDKVESVHAPRVLSGRRGLLIDCATPHRNGLRSL
jgi:hypothetical protein